jgi:hypothetical protein
MEDANKMEAVKKALQDSMDKHQKWLAQQDAYPTKEWSMKDLGNVMEKEMDHGVCICGCKIGESHSHHHHSKQQIDQLSMAIVIGVLFLIFIYFCT